MDCEQCEKSLLDLSYGELEESAAAVMRAHIEGCATCRQAFQKIEIGRAFARKLELEPAPSMSKVLAAAREQAAANRAAREQPVDAAPVAHTTPREEASSDDSGLAGWLRRLGALVMGPQLGVATVLLLVVGIGLWYLPQLGGGAGRGAPPLLEPDPQQTSETSALAPAEPLQLTHDPRTGRVTVEQPAEEEDLQGATARRDPPRTEDLARAAENEQRAPSQAQQAETDEAVLAGFERTVPTEAPPGSVRDDSLPELTSAAGSVEGEPLPPTGPTTGGVEMWVPSTTPSTAPTTERATTPQPSTQPSTQATAPQPITGSSGGSARSGTEAWDVDSVPGGPSAGDLGAAALHGQARQLAAAGRCADSVARYQQLQSRYPTYPESGRASMEMADCLRRIGRSREARVALDRATRSPVPAVASAARRQLLEMDTADRAATVTDQPASQ